MYGGTSTENPADDLQYPHSIDWLFDSLLAAYSSKQDLSSSLPQENDLHITGSVMT
jgi:hypothetical protein